MHQQFVDDTMLMETPTLREILQIKQVLEEFLEASGMKINQTKSQLFFFNTPPIVNTFLAETLGFSCISLPMKYLGVPLVDNSLKKVAWEDLIAKLTKKMDNWAFRSLNLVGRLILVKSVLQTIPLYRFSTLTAPKFILRGIRNIQRSFLWGSSKDRKKWALVSWATICKPKWAGGLGLRDLELMGTTLGAKLWWWWLTK
jgi:hypothetical protein